MLELVKTLLPARMLRPGMQVATEVFVVEGSGYVGHEYRIAIDGGWIVVPSGESLVPVYCRINRRADPARPIRIAHKEAS